MNPLKKTVGWLLPVDLDLAPGFDHYLPHPGRRPLRRTRWTATTGLLFAPAWWVFILLLIVLLGSEQSPTAGELASVLGLLGMFALPYLVITVRLPTYRWSYRPADTLRPGMWVADKPRPRGLIKVTQILSVFEHHGRTHSILIGLHNGQQRQFQRNDKVRVFRLRDPFSLIRRPHPPIRGKFNTLLSTVTAVAGFTRRHEATTAPDTYTALATQGHDQRTVVAAIDAARRLGMIDQKFTNRFSLTAAGEVWFAEQARRNGVETIKNAKEKLPVTITNRGIMQIGDHNQANLAHNSGTASITQTSSSTGSPDHDLKVLRELLAVLAQPAVRTGLHDDAVSALDEHVKTVTSAIDHRTPRDERSRQAIKNILAIAGQLIIGAAGNGLYEALKQIVA